jgi:hypothetical protein
MMAPAQPAKKKSVMPIVGGILIIVGGIIELYWGAAFIWTSNALPFDFFDFGDILEICGAILLILGIVAILGGVLAIMRKKFGIAVLGGILGLLGAFILPLIGLILVAVSKDEFD